MIRRRIRANDYAYNSQFQYADNYIKTSKYTMLTFLPYNLFEQFRRLANTYFLCLLILQLIPQISSLTPITTAVPLIVVLAITGIKDAHDDICRHKSDNQVNNRLSELLKDGKLVREPWHKVKVGDIIRIENDQFVAADLMILSTSEPNGFCFVETAELDGETNLKCRQSLSETAPLADDIEALASFNGEIVCEPPNNNLTKFEGTLFWHDDKFAVDNDKMLLRGCILRNTKWCFGLVIFAGRDTKLMQNSGKTIFKRTKSDRLLNILIMGIVLALLTMCLFSSIACGVWEMLTGRYFVKFLPREPFIPTDSFTSATITAILTFFSYLIVLNTVVPISLYVSVEVIRYCQSLLIDFDEKMYYKPKEAYAKARTTTLNEELGQVEYIFSDKTGTLTQNLMTFNKCTIGGALYGEVKDYATGEMVDISNENEHLFKPLNFADFNPEFYEPKFKFYDTKLLDQVRAGNPEVHEFFRLLALCHTVMSEEKQGRLEYQAQSPDEAALSSAARNFGFVFKNRTSNTIEIEVLGEPQTYELLAILDFNNVRKRMSVIVRDPQGKLVLYCKGADSVIFEHLNPHGSPASNRLRDTTTDHLEHFAGVGLRTLCLAKKDLDEQTYAKWHQEFHQACTAIEGREEKVDACYEAIECNLELLGATAIEDKLQDNVPQTIANLLAANIKLWVLTGDKQETAINIGYSCELLNDEMCEIFIIDGCYPEEVDKQLRRCLKQINRTQNRLKHDRQLLLLAGQQRNQTPVNHHHHHQAKLGASPMSPTGAGATQQSRPRRRRKRARDGAPGASPSGRTRAGRRQGGGGGPQQRRPQSAGAALSQARAGANPDHPKRAPRPQTATGNKVAPAAAALSNWSSLSRSNSNQQFANLRHDHLHEVEDDDDATTAAGLTHGENLELDQMMLSGDPNNNNGDNLHHNQQQESSIYTINLHEAQAARASSASSLLLLPPPNAAPDQVGAKTGSGLQTPSPTPSGASLSSPKPQLGGGDPAGGFALVINGHSLAHALCPNREELFLEVSTQCKSVICCRVTPLQKALVVDLVKRHKKVITLSIGDGANDVSMLKMAHIGVGISGQEGMQAVLASDFAVAQFCYLERLILVHGRWSYFRMCKFLRYFFYKNFSFTLCNLWYAFFCGFSAQTLFDPIFISFYNVLYTSLPVLALGIFDQDVNDRFSTKFPLLYTPGHLDLLFNKYEFLKSVAQGILTSFTTFFVTYGAFMEAVDGEGVNLDSHELFGCVVSTNLVLVVTAQAALDTSYWTVFNHIVIWGSVAFYFSMTLIFNSRLIRAQYLGVFRKALSTPIFWFTLALVLTILLVPIIAYRFYKLDVEPTLADRCRFVQRQARRRTKSGHGSGSASAHERNADLQALRRRSSTRKSRRSIRSGYAFSHQEGFGNLITSGMLIKSSSSFVADDEDLRALRRIAAAATGHSAAGGGATSQQRRR